MVQIPVKKYKVHQIFSMACCVLIVLAALFLPWMEGKRHTYSMAGYLAGIVRYGGIESFAGEQTILLWVTAGCVLFVLEVICYAVYFVVLLSKQQENMKMVFLSYYGALLSLFIAMTGELAVPAGRIRTWTPFFIVLLMFLEHFLGRMIEASVDLKQEERERVLLINLKNELLEQNYRELLEVTQRSRKVYHDFKNEVNVLNYYAEKGELDKVREYLKQIGEPVRTLEGYSWTGNEMIDLILNRKYAESLERKIQFRVESAAVGDMPIGELQICAIFGNLLDNAIEAAEKAKEENRWIHTELVRHGEIVQLTICNSLKEMPVKKDGRFISKKADGRIHGLGIENVRMMVEECGGDMQIEYDDVRFEVCITFYSC